MCIRDSVCTDQNDDWLNIYANYDVEQDRLCDTLELNLCKGDGSEDSWSYPLNAAEQEDVYKRQPVMHPALLCIEHQTQFHRT